jgi:superoxide dismutase, Cu-Zn family
MKKIALFACIALLVTNYAFAEEITVQMKLLDDKGTGRDIGTIVAKDIEYGLLLTPALTDLPPGMHGFHVHENADCGPAVKDGKKIPGEAAGGHYDPEKTGRHSGPYGKGHLGDLPALYVSGEGKASIPVLAPRLKVSDLKGRSLMIHGGGDNYTDQPKLGGGGNRIACGVVKSRKPAGGY